MARTPRVVRVRGARSFPIDMLRYDGLIPDSSADSAKIEATFTPGSRGEAVEVRLLALDGTHGATVGRWESFGWHVLEGART